MPKREYQRGARARTWHRATTDQRENLPPAGGSQNRAAVGLCAEREAETLGRPALGGLAARSYRAAVVGSASPASF